MKKLQLKKEIIESLDNVDKRNIKGGMDPETPMISLWICGVSKKCVSGGCGVGDSNGCIDPNRDPTQGVPCLPKEEEENPKMLSVDSCLYTC